MNAIEARAAGLRIALVRDIPLPNEPWYLTTEEALTLATQLLLAINDVVNRTPSPAHKAQRPLNTVKFEVNDRVEHTMSGRIGTVLLRPPDSTAPEHYIRVHWNETPPNHGANIPPAHLRKLWAS